MCAAKNNLLVIVGSKRFSSEILASFISVKTPAKWDIVEELEDLHQPDDWGDHEWRLVFIDCLGMNNDDIQLMLQTKALPYLKHDIIALFNLSRNHINLPGLIDLGVRGYFFENDPAECILKGICALKNGEMWVARGTLMEYVCQRPRKTSAGADIAKRLTKRERQVLLLLASGTSNEEISTALFISPHTIKTHIYNILKKLGVQNRLQAALWAAKNLN